MSAQSDEPPNERARCDGCGTSLPDGAPEGLCPACLFAGGLEPTGSDLSASDATIADPDWHTTTTINAPGEANDLPQATSFPTIEELKGDFPELEILEMIGRGGMGAVFKARQQSLDRLVALKVLPGNWNDSASFRDRFEREAKTLASLNHPNIVTIHEFGERNGRFFFTMEFVDGTDLARMLHEGPLEPDMALKIIPPICEAMQCAHDRGVIHRDIKPGNILVDREGRVKVADFGIAKLGTEGNQEISEGPLAQTPTDLTGPRGIVGTPRYMAPEQASASSQVDHRADLYALGVVFYEMLAGSPPPPDSGNDDTPPPSRQGSADQRWDAVILRALEQDPERRYQNATEIKTAVEGILTEDGRHIPGWITWTAFLCLAAVAALLFIIWPKPASETPPPLTNSLEMPFVPVEGVNGLVSIHETRVKDYAVFVEKTGHAWDRPAFVQTENHPVVQVSWYDALAFCKWLTAREHKTGQLPKTEVYRLPTDREWSAMAGLASEDGTTPEERNLGQTTVYPWGEADPIPEGSGNYPDISASDRFGSAVVSGYEDRHAATAPVGEFAPTADGLYDLGGNAWEWTADLFSPFDRRPVLRGGGWLAHQPDDGWKILLASFRRADLEVTEAQAWDVGFRIVRGPKVVAEETSLFALIRAGDLERMQAAIQGGAEVNTPNQAGQPPVVVAAEAGVLPILQLLHQHDGNLEASDERALTALHAASKIGHTEMVRWLLAQDVEPRPRTLAGEEPLFLAMDRAPVPLLDLLLEFGGPGTLTQLGPGGTNLLVQACFMGTDETVLWLLDHFDHARVRAADTNTRRHWALGLASRESKLLAKFLALDAGNWKAAELMMPMVATVNTGREENFALLLNAVQADALDSSMRSSLGISAVHRGRPWAIKALVNAGWDPKAFDPAEGVRNLTPSSLTDLSFNQSSTWSPDKPLPHLAIKSGKRKEFTSIKKAVEEQFPGLGRNRDQLIRDMSAWPLPATGRTLKLLHQLEVDIDARDQQDRTPLIAASLAGDLEAVETLLQLKADIEAKDNQGFTPLLCAVEKGHLEIVQLLLREDADFRAVTQFGSSVLHVVNRQHEVLRYLLQEFPGKALSIDIREDANGATPLLWLAPTGDEKVISLLLEADADVMATAERGQMAGYTPPALCLPRPQ